MLKHIKEKDTQIKSNDDILISSSKSRSSRHSINLSCIYELCRLGNTVIVKVGFVLASTEILMLCYDEYFSRYIFQCTGK